MENTYWNKQGKYQEDFDRLIKLMPDYGPAPTVGGEMMRAANRLVYDFYNNGMGNNTSGAINYLDRQGVMDRDNTNVFGVIYEYTRGRVYSGGYNGDSLQTAIEKMMDMTIEQLLNQPELCTQEHVDDLFEYQDPEQNYCDECGEETNHGYLCESCEESYEEH